MPRDGKLTEEEASDLAVLFDLAEEQIHSDAGVLEKKDFAFLFGDDESRAKGFKPLKEKFDRYGAGMFISPAQFNWAMSLHDKLKKNSDKTSSVEDNNAKKF